MIRAIALDDQPPALEIVKHFCARIDLVDLQRTFSRTQEAMAYLEAHPVDLLILDINMPAVSGIDFCKSLPKKIMIIFATAYSEHAVEGFSLNAVDYLLKPFSFDRFLQAITKADEYLRFSRLAAAPSGAELPFILVKMDYGLVKVVLSDILYAEGLDNYLKIYLQDQEPLLIRMTLKALLEKLPPADFVRVHRSYIVPLGRISNLRNKILTVAGREIPLGASYEEGFNKVFGS